MGQILNFGARKKIKKKNKNKKTGHISCLHSLLRIPLRKNGGSVKSMIVDSFVGEIPALRFVTTFTTHAQQITTFTVTQQDA
jgi:hypothetical protein